MAAPAYNTDLETVNLSTGTWGEFSGAAAGSAPTENDVDNFIAGSDSTTEAVKATDTDAIATYGWCGYFEDEGTLS